MLKPSLYESISLRHGSAGVRGVALASRHLTFASAFSSGKPESPRHGSASCLGLPTLSGEAWNSLFVVVAAGYRYS